MSTITVAYGLLYFKTVPGAFKVVELLCNFIGFMCVVTAHASNKGDAFLAASIGAFIITALLLFFYITGLAEKLFNIQTLFRIEFCFCVIWSLFYLIVSAIIIDLGYDPYIAGGVFGLFAIAVYILDGVHKYKGAQFF